MNNAISGRSEFRAALAQALRGAADSGEREIVMVDADFAEWPLDDREVLDALAAWIGPQRKLTLIAHRYDEVPRRYPRFVQWRQTWAHLITARGVPELDASEVPGLLLAGPHSLQVTERLHWRARWLSEESDRRTWTEVVDAISQRSEDAFPASTLGL